MASARAIGFLFFTFRREFMDITIRHAELGDLDALHRLWSMPHVIWGTLQLPYPSTDVWRKRLTDRPEGLYQLVAVADGDVVGSLGLHTFPNAPRRRHIASLGMGVRDDLQGRGIGSALMQAATSMCDQWLQIRRLELEVYVDNPAAIALYKKFGFEIEGTLRMYGFRDGQYVDVYAMSRLRVIS
jgi:putative acetyltransferase